MSRLAFIIAGALALAAAVYAGGVPFIDPPRSEPPIQPNPACLSSSECASDQICCNYKGKAVCTPKNSCKGVELGPR